MTTLSTNSSNISFPPISKEAILNIFKANVKPHTSLLSFFDSMPEVFSKEPLEPESYQQKTLPDPKDVFYPPITLTNRPQQHQQHQQHEKHYQNQQYQQQHQQHEKHQQHQQYQQHQQHQQQKPYQKKKYIVPKAPFTSCGLTENPNAKVWYYIDESEDTQGPFTSAEMDGWYEEGYFSTDLLLRFRKEGEFRKLNEVVGKPEYSQQNPNTGGQFTKGPMGQGGNQQQQGYHFQNRTGGDNKGMARNTEGEGAKPTQGFVRGTIRSENVAKDDKGGASDKQGWNRNQGKTNESPEKPEDHQEGKIFKRAAREQDDEKKLLIHHGQKPAETLVAQGEESPEPVEKPHRHHHNKHHEKHEKTEEHKAYHKKEEHHHEKPSHSQYQRVPQAEGEEEETSEWTSVSKTKPKKKHGKGHPNQPQGTEQANVAQEKPTEAPQKAEKDIQKEEKKTAVEPEPVKVEPTPQKEAEQVPPAQPIEEPKVPEPQVTPIENPELKLKSLPTEIDTYGVLPTKGKKGKGKKMMVTGWLGEDEPPAPSKTKEVASQPAEAPVEMDFPTLGDFTKVVKKAVPKVGSKNNKATPEEELQQQRELQQQLERQQQVERAARQRQEELERIRLQQQKELELKAQKEKEEAEAKKTPQVPVVTTEEFPALGGFPSLSAANTQKSAPKKTGKQGTGSGKKGEAPPKQASAGNPKYLEDFPSL